MTIIKSPTDIIVESLLGKSWFTSNDLSDLFDINKTKASQLMQHIRNTKKYKTTEKKVGKYMYVKVDAIEYPAAPPPVKFHRSKERQLWRLALFGFKIDAMNKNT